MDKMEDQAILTVLNVFIGDLDGSTKLLLTKGTNAPLDGNYMTCWVLDFRTKAYSMILYIFWSLYFIHLPYTFFASHYVELAYCEMIQINIRPAPGDFKQAPSSVLYKKRSTVLVHSNEQLITVKAEEVRVQYVVVNSLQYMNDQRFILNWINQLNVIHCHKRLLMRLLKGFNSFKCSIQ